MSTPILLMQFGRCYSFRLWACNIRFGSVCTDVTLTSMLMGKQSCSPNAPCLFIHLFADLRRFAGVRSVRRQKLSHRVLAHLSHYLHDLGPLLLVLSIIVHLDLPLTCLSAFVE